MASSGMGSAEIRSLKVQDFLDSLTEYFRSPLKLPLDIPQIRKKLENKLVIPTFKIVRVKITLPYTTFATPEAVNAIFYYLEKYPPQTPDDYLFPNTIKNKEKPITDNAFGKYFNRINNKCGFGHVNRSVKFHSHSLRKYFASTLINKDIKQWSIDAMLGHAVKNRTTNAYFKPDPTIIKNDYFKIVKDLSMEEIEVKTMDSPEFQELKDKNQKDSMAKAEK
ncbi:MAG: site-specific integrase [Methanobacterium sp. ERen5]|nr:MAG: site-specific integrase [Methanobacterium sp. ERen5]